MSPQHPRTFHTMRCAAEALVERLTQLQAEAIGHDEHDARYYEDRLRHVKDIVAGADPDDTFEQDAFRQLFAQELRTLEE